MFEIIIEENLQKLFNILLEKNTLRSSRYYETFKGGKGNTFLWHHDEKSIENKSNVLKSLILIIYFNNVLKFEDGPFQFIKGSHLYSHKYEDLKSRTKKIIDFRKFDVDSEFKDSIQTVYGNAGTALIADGRIIHRATERKAKGTRKVFFIQVCSTKLNTTKERILFDPSFVSYENLISNKHLFDFFGYGINNTGSNFPPSKLNDSRVELNLLKEILKWIIIRSGKKIKKLFN